jgi:hypothetical protein
MSLHKSCPEEYCNDCNYAQHICASCGDWVAHSEGRVCAACRRIHAPKATWEDVRNEPTKQLSHDPQCWEVAGIDPEVGSEIRCKLDAGHTGGCEPEA